VAALVGGAAIAAPVLLALVGIDFVLTRSLLGAWLPLAVVAAVGLGGQRSGAAGAFGTAALCGAGAACVALVATDPDFQREDWRGLASALRRQAEIRAIVVTPGDGPTALWPYLEGVRRMPPAGATVREIAVAALPVLYDVKVDPPLNPGTPTPAPPVEGFEAFARRDGQTFTLVRYRSLRPRRVTVADLAGASIDRSQPASLLLQQPGTRPPTRIDMSCEGWTP
jgi:hypothetical protein